MRTSTLITLTIVGAILILVQAQTPAIPRIPRQFTCAACNFTIASGGSKSISMGKYWYDEIANNLRQDYSFRGAPFEFLEAIGHTGTGHTIMIFPGLTPPQCAVETVFGPISVDQFSWVSVATYMGKEMINGIQCDHWNQVGELETFDLWVQSSSVNTPVRFLATSFKHDYEMIDFLSFAPGQPDPSVFAIPSYCNIRV